MTWTTTWKRLHRFFAVLVVLALPLQGQAVASMSCHTMPAGLAATQAMSAADMGHSHQQTVVHQHDHVAGHHQVSTPASNPLTHDSHVTTSAHSQIVAFAAPTDLPSSPSDMMNAESCALCAAGCSVAAPLPTVYKSVSPSPSDRQQPALLITSAYTGVVLDGLLRPPR
ncbi:hypothetical protein AOB54_05570 [beta proteobacterium MWH-UniP1]